MGAVEGVGGFRRTRAFRRSAYPQGIENFSALLLLLAQKRGAAPHYQPKRVFYGEALF